jgi:hypothetical protein
MSWVVAQPLAPTGSSYVPKVKHIYAKICPLSL